MCHAMFMCFIYFVVAFMSNPLLRCISNLYFSLLSSAYCNSISVVALYKYQSVLLCEANWCKFGTNVVQDKYNSDMLDILLINIFLHTYIYGMSEINNLIYYVLLHNYAIAVSTPMYMSQSYVYNLVSGEPSTPIPSQQQTDPPDDGRYYMPCKCVLAK